MKAVARLVWSYFMGTFASRALTILGLLLFVVSFYILTTQPQSSETLSLAVGGLIAFFLGSSLMPVMFGRMARSHSIKVLPYGRLKLLLSAFFTAIVVSIPGAILTPALYVAGNSGSIEDFAKYPGLLEFTLHLAQLIFTSILLISGWLYLAMWFIASERNRAGFVKGLLVIVVVIFAPARDFRDLTVMLSWNLQQIAVIWIVFGTGFLLWPRYQAAIARRSRRRFADVGVRLARDTVGREFDLMLGTANPWLLIGALVVPVIIATRFVDGMTSVWLYFLTIFSTVAGAIAGEAASRSRSLWLRGGWSRAALFSAIERSFWRHNGYVLGSLMLLTIGIGSYAGFSARMLAAGLPLLMLGTVLSTYLGLMITRGLRWIEVTLGVVVMLALMASAEMVAQENVSLTAVIALEIALAVFAIVLRVIAQRRWTQIDWMLCRRDRALSARAA
jgi:hypothetical protein